MPQHYPTTGVAAKRRAQKHRQINRNALATSTSNPNLLTQVIEPWMPLFPAKTTRMLRYSTNFQLSSTAGVPATYVFRANDCFDPDFSGTGHQPMGFDQMMLFYNHFCVTHARLVITAVNNGSPTGVFCIRQDATSTPLTVIDRIIEVGGLTQATIEAKAVSGDGKLLELKLDIAHLQGISSSAITADPTLRGDAATSPTEVSYFHVSLWDASGLSPVVNFNAILEQRVVFLEPRDGTESFVQRANFLAMQRRVNVEANLEKDGTAEFVTVRRISPGGPIVADCKCHSS